MHANVTAALLGLVEGLTEFLPISSTGHLILASDLLDFKGAAADSFNIFVQLGAILAVIVYYRQRFFGLFTRGAGRGFSGWNGAFLLALTTAPALGVGYLLHHEIKDFLFHPRMVAIGLAAGAVAILLIERRGRPDPNMDLETIDWKTALGIGLIQCAALWPGVSRSAATILGALMLGLNRRAATEYSFFAAIPILVLAALYDTITSWPILTAGDLPVFSIGFIVAFFSAWAAIKFLIRFVGGHTFSAFAWYRLVLAVLVFWFLRT